jgi:WS/DGAT C-terminal domain
LVTSLRELVRAAWTTARAPRRSLERGRSIASGLRSYGSALYYPFVPLGAGVRIGVAIMSYNGQLRFGITGDYDTAPDIGVVADGIDAAVATLVCLADAGTAEPAIDLTDTPDLAAL